MGFFRKIGEFLGIVEENKTEKIMNERSEIKNTLANNLKGIGFTEDEIEEVLDVVTKSEEAIQEQKDLLIGTNINNPDPNIIMREIFDEIKRLQLQTGVDVKAKIAEIKARKGM